MFTADTVSAVHR